ncbi:MAG TPA: protein translocase subunit SecD [Bryobacteraceae bacterium]|nr:protein translocase subunit SecD [Bryobacteraceae bacterium]
MASNLKVRALIILGVILICVYGIIGLPTSRAQIAENLKHNLRLGLDLRGGSQLVIQVQLQDAFKAEADDVINRMKDALRKADIEYADINRNDPQSIQQADQIQINVSGIPPTKAGDFRKLINDNFADVWILTPVNQSDFRLTMKPSEALRLKQDTLTQSTNTIEKKINGLGLAEATVQPRGGSSDAAELLVQLPGIDDPARVKQILGTQAVLELKEVLGGPFQSQEEAMASKNGVLPLNAEVQPTLARPGEPRQYYILSRSAVVTGRDLRDARAQQSSQSLGWETNFVLSQDAARRFESFTGSHTGDRLAIVLDKQVLSAPVIKNKISDNGVIEGLSGHDEAADLALNLKSGSLPAGVEYLEDRSVGASLGSDSIREGIISGVAGVIAVVTIMLIYYKGAGVNATLALILNAIILIAALSYFGAVLTLPGIAGVILTVGMAVDSNVLIFERIREELRAGKAAVAAMEAGFSKALLTIIDTHVTTVVSCAFLFLFGTTQVKGFAVTLVIGLLANVFTAIFVSKTIFYWELGRQRQAVTLSI